ncbi:MAG: HAD family phosphatase [Rhizobiaceae bacterium]|nr:HAD family phosphatase [Rhizobiaceae bacterium]
MPQPELVIFDCDGVLVDSEIIAARIDTELLAEAGVEIEMEDFISRYAGLTFKEIALRVEKEYGVPLQASIIDRSKKLLDERLGRDVKAVDGARAAVMSVAGPKCVCSNSPSERLEAMLGRTGLLPLFSGNIFSARATPSGKPKPAPDVFLYGAERMGANPANCFVVEDSVHGITGAKAAGMRVIGFTGGAHSWPGHADALTEAGAETVIRRWADLPGVLAALAMWSEDAG